MYCREIAHGALSYLIKHSQRGIASRSLTKPHRVTLVRRLQDSGSLIFTTKLVCYTRASQYVHRDNLRGSWFMEELFAIATVIALEWPLNS